MRLFPISLRALRLCVLADRLEGRLADGGSPYPEARARPAVERGFEFFEHTADVGIRAWGPTMDAAFAEAARGLVANMIDTSQAREVGEARLEVEAETLERLLFRFLEEVLFLFETERWVITSADVALTGETRLVATLRGEAYEAARHGHVHEIKAITFHGLAIRRDPPEVRVIVDI